MRSILKLDQMYKNITVIENPPRKNLKCTSWPNLA